jgi:hypothetical protein
MAVALTRRCAQITARPGTAIVLPAKWAMPGDALAQFGAARN